MNIKVVKEGNSLYEIDLDCVEKTRRENTIRFGKNAKFDIKERSFSNVDKIKKEP